MSTLGKRVIYAGPAGEGALMVEGIALDAVVPGSLVTSVATGIQTSADASTVFGTLPLFANKDELRSRSVDDAWTINESMVAIQPKSGEFINALVATGQTITKVGTGLASNGDGTLKIAAVNGTDAVICYSDEIVTTTATTLVRVRVA